MIIVDDSFISEEYAITTEEMILSETRPIFWTLNKQTNVPDDDNIYAIPDKNTYQTLQFVSHVDNGHPLYGGIYNIFNEFVSKHKIDFSEVIRIKINFIPASSTYDYEKYHMPHVDSDSPHKVFIYYVTDSDGDTVLFDQTLTGEKPTEFTIMQRVSPKRGRGMVFDGLTYHASSSPLRHPYRCIINVDFV